MIFQPLQSSSLPANIPASLPQSPRPSLAARRVLLIEDDVILVRFLERILQSEGMTVQAVHNGLDALALVPFAPDLVILDLNLPGLDGLHLLPQLRERLPHVAVLVLTGRSRSESAVHALEGGADDCLHKPFSHLELVARLRALLRRQTAPVPPEPATAELMLHKATFRVTRDGQQISLTPREFALLEFLMRSPGTPVPRSVLHQELWGEQSIASSNVVDVYMKYLRDKIDTPGKPRLIQTIRGVGYVFSAS